MALLKGQTAVVTGGSRGLGKGIVEALVAQQANVTVVARDQGRLDEISKQPGVQVVSGDITDRELARHLLSGIRPSIVVLNAGETPVMRPIHELLWEEFNRVWDIDVKATFHWVQEVLLLPLPRGSRVLIGSSGAAVNGSPLSGSYAGAKRMQWFMASYANGIATDLDLGIRFQAMVPMQIIGETALGQVAAQAYAKRKGVSLGEYLAGFGAPMPPQVVGDHVVSILTDPRYETGVAFGMHGERGIVSLDK